jgi:hypothetical protein
VTWNNGFAVSVDGTTLLASDSNSKYSTDVVRVFSTVDGAALDVVGGTGSGPLQFKDPRQVCVAPDGFVFVADAANHRVQELSPRLNFRRVVGEGHLRRPVGVCASVDLVVVSDATQRCLLVFRRSDVSVVARVGDDGVLEAPRGVCFMPDHRRVAVADRRRVSVFDVDGSLVRHVGEGVLDGPESVACSAWGELVVTCGRHRCVRVFSDLGDVVTTLGDSDFAAVTVHGSTVFAQDHENEVCVVWV